MHDIQMIELPAVYLDYFKSASRPYVQPSGQTVRLTVVSI